MFAEREYRVAIIVSLLTHGLILLHNPNFFSFEKNKNRQVLEIQYLKFPRPEKVSHKNIDVGKEILPQIVSKMMVEKQLPPSFIEREKIAKINREVVSGKDVISKFSFKKPGIVSVKKKISLPPAELEKINNPSYLSYYEIVREKIRRAAYQNYTNTEVGEVYLAFVISRNGSLMNLMVIEEQTSASKNLQDIALRSLKQASPFPVFPNQLDYSQLPFNLPISFEEAE